jgi:hypothetical protein
MRQTESEHSREARMRRTYDVNKELADDLRAGYTVVIGSTTIWTSSGVGHLIENETSHP